MNDKTLDCIVLPAHPAPFLLPKACVADTSVVGELESVSDKKVEWVAGHINWDNQRIPVIDLQSLIYGKAVDSEKQHFAILNPVANAARRSFTAIVCSDQPQEIVLPSDVAYGELDAEADKRYVEAIVNWDEKDYLLPRLTSLSVAFTYV